MHVHAGREHSNQPRRHTKSAVCCIDVYHQYVCSLAENFLPVFTWFHARVALSVVVEITHGD